MGNKTTQSVKINQVSRSLRGSVSQNTSGKGGSPFLTENTKKCSKCGEVRPLSEFYKNNCCPGRKGYRCRSCLGSKPRKKSIKCAHCGNIRQVWEKCTCRKPKAKHYVENRRKRGKKYTANLVDFYILGILRGKNKGHLLQDADIPIELIALKRAQLQIKRFLKGKKNEDNERIA